MADFRRRFKEVRRLLLTTVGVNDALSLGGQNVPLIIGQATAATRFTFATSPNKTAAFSNWLTGILDEIVLKDFDPLRAAEPNPFIFRTVGSAVTRADQELNRVGVLTPRLVEELALPSNIPGGLSTTLETLYTRNYEALRGITAETSRQIAAELSSGTLAGIGPRQMARAMTQVIDISIQRATLMARTEVINAYAESSLDRFEQMGITNVTPRVEFTTAGDDRVCIQCEQLDGVVRTTKQARGVIPVHPACRCAWLPLPLTTNALLRNFFRRHAYAV